MELSMALDFLFPVLSILACVACFIQHRREISHRFRVTLRMGMIATTLQIAKKLNRIAPNHNHIKAVV